MLNALRSFYKWEVKIQFKSAYDLLYGQEQYVYFIQQETSLAEVVAQKCSVKKLFLKIS